MTTAKAVSCAFSLSCFSVPNFTEYVEAAEVIQAVAPEAGIALDIQVNETATLVRQWTAGDFELLVIT